MNVREIVALKLQPALKECEQHRLRLYAAWEEAASFEALREDSTAELTDEQVRTLDQLLFRFAKLQDAIRMRLLPATLKLVEEWLENEPFLDRLNRAEKLGMLPSVEQWRMLRELRNQVAHEYLGQPETMCANLRRLIAKVPVLEEAFDQLANWSRLQIPKILDADRNG